MVQVSATTWVNPRVVLYIEVQGDYLYYKVPGASTSVKATWPPRALEAYLAEVEKRCNK